MDYLIIVLLGIIICLNVVKAYVFLNPINNVSFLYFWERGSVRRELQPGLILLTNISFGLLGISLLAILGELFFEIPAVYKNELKLENLLVKKSIQIFLLIIASFILFISWDGVIP